MKLKTILLAAAVALTSASAFAAGYTTIEVAPYEGDTIKVKISDNLTTTFDGEDMLFADGEAQNRVALKDVKSISFKADVEAGISAVATDGDVSIEPGRVILGNLAAGSRIAVVALDGRTVLSAVAEGSYTISLDTLEAGVYVISYNKRSLKIAVK